MIDLLGHILLFLGFCVIGLVGTVLLCSIVDYFDKRKTQEEKEELIKLMLSTIVFIMIGIGVYKIGDSIIDYDRNCRYEEMQSRSLLIEDVYVDKILKDKHNIGHVNLVKDDYLQSFRLWYGFDDDVGGIKKGDRIDMRFDPETNMVLKVINVYHEDTSTSNPFIIKSF